MSRHCEVDALKVYYGKEAFIIFEHAAEFEIELDRLCNRYGLYRWASGYSVEDDVRDIAYDRGEEK